MIGSVRGGKLFENKNEVLIVKMYFKIDYFMNKNIRAVMMVAAIALVSGMNMYNSNSINFIPRIMLNEVESIAACETSSNHGNNTGYCSELEGSTGDACVSSGSGNEPRCSGNI